MNAMTRPSEGAAILRPLDAPVGWGAAVIDDKGNEVPITESMIARACEELASCWVFPKEEKAGVAF